MDRNSDKPAALFILLRAMGDVLLATPAIRAFKQHHPDLEIDVLVEKIPAQTLRNNPDIRELIIAPNRGSRIDKFLPIIKKLRSFRYRIVVDFQSTPGSAFLTKLIRAPLRIGFDRRWRSWAYTEAIPPEESVVYATIPKFKLLSRFGIAIPSCENGEVCLPKLYTNSSNIRAAQLFLESMEIESAGNLIALAPFCRREWRMWPLRDWQRLLLAHAKLRSVTWLLFASPEERLMLQEIERIQGARVIWAGMNDLLDAAALMGKCRALVGGENGLLHLAVASRIPTFTIFCGRDEPGRWIPAFSKTHAALDFRGKSEESCPEDAALSLEAFLSTLRDYIEQ